MTTLLKLILALVLIPPYIALYLFFYSANWLLSKFVKVAK